MYSNNLSPQQNSLNLSTYEKDQRRRTLSVILTITTVAAAIFGGLNLFFYESQTPAIVFFVVSLLCLPTLWLNLRDRYELSGLITTLLVISMAHYNLVDGAGIRDPGVVAYPLIILIGGLLFGKRALPFFTLTGIVSLVIVVGLDSSFDADIDRLLIISTLLLVGAGATRLVLENIENNINRIRESEGNLWEALDQSRKHLQRINGIIETVPEGVLLLNTDHQIILANKTAHDFLVLLAPAHLQEEPLTQVGRFSIEELIRNAGAGWQEIILDAPERIFEAAVRPVQQVPLPYQNWVLVLRDATQERKQQEILQEQERLAVVGQLASGIAHDFRNILNVISIYSQIVDKRSGSQQYNDYFKVIREQIKDAARLIEQVLDFGRRTIMQRRAFDVVALVENVIKLLQRTLPSNIEIIYLHDPGEYILNADSGRLQQALMNLAVNARDAMPDGGILKFTLTKDGIPERITGASPSPGQDWLMLSIQDTGEGVHPEDLPYIFEPFFTTKKASKGTGLGLAQVYGIVKQHEGEITVSSEQGQGTTFNLFFPTTSEIMAAPTSQSEGEVKLDRKITILLVEDNTLTRTSTEEMLVLLGCQVVTAENGRQALEIYGPRLDTINLVISDIVMPAMSGVELYQELQKIAPQLKFLVITGYPLNNQARELLEQGYIDWIQKPFLAEELARKINSMVGAPLESV
jgi:signal transduction histidine kinase/CheY-like chemotaxis protein